MWLETSRKVIPIDVHWSCQRADHISFSSNFKLAILCFSLSRFSNNVSYKRQFTLTSWMVFLKFPIGVDWKISSSWRKRCYICIETVCRDCLLTNERHCISRFSEKRSSLAELLLFISECVAVYNYTGEAGDLCFSEGDVIKVYKDEGEWWEGSCRGEQGLFPANYVKKRETEVLMKTYVESVWTGVGLANSVEYWTWRQVSLCKGLC